MRARPLIRSRVDRYPLSLALEGLILVVVNFRVGDGPWQLAGLRLEEMPLW